MKKFRRLFMVLLAVLLIAAFASTALAASYVEATGTRVNVRSGPGTGYPDLYTLVKGEQVEYLGSSRDSKGATWYKVQYYSYGTGWVSAHYSKLVDSYDSSSALPEFTFGYGSVKITGGSVNIRKSPNLNGKYIDGVGKGDILTYLGQTSTDDRGVVWYKVEFEGEDGWVSSRYSELTNSVSLPDFSFTSQYVKADDGNCNVRSTPSLNGTDLDTMKKGEKAAYLGASSTDDRGVVWYKVSYNGKTGWVSSRYSSLVK